MGKILPINALFVVTAVKFFSLSLLNGKDSYLGRNEELQTLLCLVLYYQRQEIRLGYWKIPFLEIKLVLVHKVQHRLTVSESCNCLSHEQTEIWPSCFSMDYVSVLLCENNIQFYHSDSLSAKPPRIKNDSLLSIPSNKSLAMVTAYLDCCALLLQCSTECSAQRGSRGHPVNRFYAGVTIPWYRKGPACAAIEMHAF